MRLELNAHPLESEHIINKTRTLTMRDGRTLGWLALGGWRVPYAPDFEANEKTTSPARIISGDAHRWVFDVTRLVRPAGNKLVIVASPNLPMKSPLTLGNIELIYKPSEFVHRVKWEEEEEPSWSGTAVFVPAKTHRVDYRAEQRGERALRVWHGLPAHDGTRDKSASRAGSSCH